MEKMRRLWASHL